MKIIVEVVKKFFYLFLDISGSLLGVFLMIIGWLMQRGLPLPGFTGWIVFGLGIAALLIHGSHYIVARKRGSEYFYTTRKKEMDDV